VGDVDVEVISATENSNKFQKARFCKEKMVEDVLTLGLGPTAESTESIVHYPRTHETECRCHQNRIYVMKASNFQNLEFRNYVFVLWARFRTHLHFLSHLCHIVLK
jgi:hypothetical protein